MRVAGRKIVRQHALVGAFQQILARARHPNARPFAPADARVKTVAPQVHHVDRVVVVRSGRAQQILRHGHGERGADEAERARFLRVARGKGDRSQRAHGMPDNGRLLDAELIENGRDPIGHVLDR